MNKIDEFHIPFIKSLVCIAGIVIVSLCLSHIFIPKLLSTSSNSPQYTSYGSGIETEPGK